MEHLRFVVASVGEISGQVVYYVGPTPPKPGQAVGAAGPTSSYRMDAYAPLLMEKGLKTLSSRWETMALAYKKGRFSETGPITPALLLGEHYLVSTKGCVFRTLLERHFSTWGDRLPHLMEVGSIQVVKNLCACNLGLAFLPRYALEKEIESGQLDCIIPDGLSQKSIATQMVVHENKALTPAMNILIGKLSENLLSDGTTLEQ